MNVFVESVMFATRTFAYTLNYEKMVDLWIKIILTDDIELLKNNNYKK